MHLLIPFAAPPVDIARQVLRGLALPQLQALLSRLSPAATVAGDEVRDDEGDELSLTPPHERALARAYGWSGADGAMPFAAHAAAADGIAPGDQVWVLLTPSHWQLGTDHAIQTDPEALALDDTTSRALFDAVQELFTSEGFVLRYGAPLRWYLAHGSLAQLRLASLDRVVGRRVERWLPASEATRLLRRLQNEVQMLLHAHPLNEAREARGLLPVNSYWLSGCGVAQTVRAGVDLNIDARLRTPALAGDWGAWQVAWLALDAGPLAELAARDAAGESVRLTLAGERSSRTLASGRGSLWQRLSAGWRRPEPAVWLEAL